VDFHHLDSCHAWHTTKRLQLAAGFSSNAPFSTIRWHF
jgi:hypothetical protein